MRFLADENVPASAVSALVAAGHDVKSVRKDAPGSSDDHVLALAARERRTLVTFDKDFGDLAWRYPLPRDCGIILFRLAMPSPSKVARVIVDAIAARTLDGPFLSRRAKVVFGCVRCQGESKNEPASSHPEVPLLC